ncbi:cobalt-precorrin-6A reductase [Shimia isoporae]|uniref:cobalt-precorrin-6A reductase n=1 Tax=Shimia isoporae TaxID=647720 RepID=UPI00104A7371|nr:cobalt-precorrin-6A reductase [Shimia isoporae]
MTTKLLILGGTTEASQLASFVAQSGVDAVFSYAGRVATPKAQPLPTRIGGFGGIDGLVGYLRAHNITHVVDATHPFATQMSWNAFHACQSAGVQLIALSRPAWKARKKDLWTHVPDIGGAVDALQGEARRVLLALGKQNVPAFADQAQHHYILRLVDEPEAPPPLPHHTIVVSRGPFTLAGDLAMMKELCVDVVVCKNSGGIGAEAKLVAARKLGLPVIMIDRAELPPRREVSTVEAVLDWVTN